MCHHIFSFRIALVAFDFLTNDKDWRVCPKAKKGPFWHFFCVRSEKNSSGRQSDNINASGLPNTSFESFCPKLFREHVKNVGTFKIGGPSPLQSHLIQIRVAPKSYFSGSFLQKMASHGQTVHFWLYSVIHRWKAMDLSFFMVFLKKYFVNPAKRQNFRDASGQIFSLILRPCHMYYKDFLRDFFEREKYNTQVVCSISSSAQICLKIQSKYY